MKNYLIGVALLLLAFYLMMQQGQSDYQRTQDHPGEFESDRSVVPDGNASLDRRPQVVRESSLEEGAPSFEVRTSLGEEETFEGMGNDYSSMVFSNHSGGIREIRVNECGRLSKSYKMRQKGDPFLGISFEDENGNALAEKIPDPRAFKLIEQKEEGKVVYGWESRQRLKIERIFWRESNETYLFRHRTILSNRGDQPLDLKRLRLHLGSAFQIPRMYNPFDNASTYLNVGYYNAGPALPEGCSCATCSGRIDGEAEEFIQLNEMGSSGRMEVRYLTQARWACVNNQFFVSLVRPISDMASVRISGNSLHGDPSVNEEESLGVEGSMSFPVGLLGPGESKSFEFEIYAGPKDYMGLKSLGAEQKKVMQFGVFWWVSEPLSWALNYLSGLLGSYGFGIIVLTIIVKLLLWPLTAQATRSQKRMQALQGPMSKLREKHKGNPQKLNQEMMKFYKEHKVNPFAGCWPILIQIPIFLGMFWMLRSASELYGQGFLWAGDLSEQDNVSTIQGFSLNLLPIFMVATQWYQMRLNPLQMGPEMSEAQRLNAKMMRFMPFMFLVFLYFFSSALVLYWTVQNLMTILQTLTTKTNQDGKTDDRAETAALDDSANEYKKLGSDDVPEEERRARNMLGLKIKGKINPNKLEENYKQRLLHYEESKLEGMSPSKRRSSLEKKERLQAAYEFLITLTDKQS